MDIVNRQSHLREMGIPQWYARYSLTGAASTPEIFIVSADRALSKEKSSAPKDLGAPVLLPRIEVVSKSQNDITPLTESTFAWQHNEDAMASEKLSEGIRNFAKDQAVLDQLVTDLVKQTAIA